MLIVQNLSHKAEKKNILFDGLTYSTRGYFACCVNHNRSLKVTTRIYKAMSVYLTWNTVPFLDRIKKETLRKK